MVSFTRIINIFVFAIGLVTPAIGLSEVRAADACAAVPLSRMGVVARACPVDFPLLWQGAAAIDGEYIRITGYVTYVDGFPYLFASKDLYTYMAARGGVMLEVDAEEEDRLKVLAGSGGPITLQGRFRLEGRRLLPGSIGALAVIGRHYWQQEIPGEPPVVPPL